MIRDKLEQNIINLLIITFIPLFIEFLIIIILSSLIGNQMNEFFNIICILISTVIACIIFPYIILKKIYNISLNDVGLSIGNLSKKQLILSILILSMNLIAFKKLVLVNSLLLIFHNIVIAISEEFLSRGCITYILKKIFKSNIFILIANVLIFVFIFHSGETLFSNIIYRLPISILLMFTYTKYKNLMLPISIHLTYNVIGAIFS